MAAPYFFEDMLPILPTLLNKETQKKKSESLGERIQKADSDDDIHRLFEIDTEFSILSLMKVDDKPKIPSLSAKDFVDGVLKATTEEIMKKNMIDAIEGYSQWNPFYPIPFITSQLLSLSESNKILFRGEKRKLFPKLIDTLKKFHTDDIAFNSDISPKKRNRSPQSNKDR